MNRIIVIGCGKIINKKRPILISMGLKIII